ncbi:MAG: prepilin-type N-terminal cleavage/methylation domain-containing protein [Candidatus Omnitrophica bacterium]|nr:prepilin-type N-terminal cleavage/methylation domain-containing protein [Candidatus Omnitrophota bacterium]
MQKGFTLIELLIVVAIIGILAAIAVPNFLNAQVRAKIAKVEGEFRSISTALEAYNLDRNGYLPYPDWGGHTHPRYLNALSTPITYLSAPDSIYDPFRKQYIADNDGVDKPRYGYFDPRTSPVQWFIEPSSYQGVKLPGNYQYTLISIGPSHVQHVDGGTPTGFIVYDPTNGVSSWGNIYRFGP